MTKKPILTIFVVFSTIALADPAFAQEWAQRADEGLQTVITGLKFLGRGVATVILIWKIFEIMGGKPIREMVPWFLGAVLFLSATEIVSLFFGSSPTS